MQSEIKLGDIMSRLSEPGMQRFTRRLDYECFLEVCHQVSFVLLHRTVLFVHTCTLATLGLAHACPPVIVYGPCYRPLDSRVIVV